jgi:quinol-cytochrome oxidoreductase complex cytochrome b subunit
MGKDSSSEAPSFLQAITPVWVILCLGMTYIVLFHEPSADMEDLAAAFGAGPAIMAIVLLLVGLSLLAGQIRRKEVARPGYIVLALAIMAALLIAGMILAKLALPVIQNGLVMLLPAAGVMLAPSVYRKVVDRHASTQ